MIEPSDLAALICATAITVTVGAVLLLGPLARRLPALLEKMIEQRVRPTGLSPRRGESDATLEARIERLEARLGTPEAGVAVGDASGSSDTVPTHGRRSFGQ